MKISSHLTLRSLIISFSILILFARCNKSSSCSFDACAIKASASEITSVQNYLTANSITATQHCSGLFYRIDQPGTGASPDACSNVTVTYTGTLTNGTNFDQSASAVSFSLEQVITAWRIALPLIKAGGSIYLYVPPSLGYGSIATGPIPANSILIFKVNLLAVN